MAFSRGAIVRRRGLQGGSLGRPTRRPAAAVGGDPSAVVGNRRPAASGRTGALASEDDRPESAAMRRRNRRLFLLGLAAIELGFLVGAGAIFTVGLYDRLTKVEADCGGRYHGQTPALFSAPVAAEPYLMPASGKCDFRAAIGRSPSTPGGCPVQRPTPRRWFWPTDCTSANAPPPCSSRPGCFTLTGSQS